MMMVLIKLQHPSCVLAVAAAGGSGIDHYPLLLLLIGLIIINI
jgi:hypothetical protein